MQKFFFSLLATIALAAFSPTMASSASTMRPCVQTVRGWIIWQYAPNRKRVCLSAQVNTQRGTVECAEIPADQYMETNVPMYGSKSLPQWDYSAYWENLRQNANERIHTMTGKYPIEPIEPMGLEQATGNRQQETGVEKRMVNGQLIILKSGRKFNAQGQEL